MKAVIQRVSRASVTVDGTVTGKIGQGYLILLGVGPDDSERECDKLADKISGLRIFSDENDKINLSIKDVNGLNAEAFSAFTHITVDVEGANGYTAKSYNVYYKDNAAACDKANKWHFTVA